MEGTTYCDGSEGDDGDEMLLSETAPSEHHTQTGLTEQFQVGNRQTRAETLLATCKPSTHLSFHFPVHSTSPQGFRILISFCTVPRKFT